MSINIPTPTPQSVDINGTNYDLVAFYYPGHKTSWDKIYNAPFLGNFWECSVTLTINNESGTFQTAEAAFQATKWWGDTSTRKKFEACKTGDDAFKLKKTLKSPDYSYAGLGRDGSMEVVLTAKFSDAALQKALILTKGSYLLEHNSKKGRDNYWSDDHDGTGQNMLGKSLMKLRDQLASTNDYPSLKDLYPGDFTAKVEGK